VLHLPRVPDAARPYPPTRPSAPQLRSRHARLSTPDSLTGVALALGSGLLWGCADFWGGVISRRAPVLAVTLLSQGVGFVGLLVAFAFVHELSWSSFRFGLAAGVGGASGLALFYWALSIGTMSIVAPISACAAIVPFSLALASGDRPSALALAGAALAIVGIVVASLEERRAPAQARAIVIAVAAAVMIGVFLYFLGKGGDAGSAFSTLFGSRIVSFSLLAAAAVYAQTMLALPRPRLVQIALVGAADLTANALFALAADRGLLAIVSVLGSVYPIATVVLAHLVLGERITGVQRIGVLCAFVGVACVSLG
jgi:drug/metabolite transporter (DMT)-like permease